MNDVIHTLSVALLTISNAKLEYFQKATKDDDALKLVIKWYKEGWPSSCSLGGETKHYFNMKNHITIEEELVYYQDRLIIPVICRNDMLKLIHETHNGIVKSKMNAKKYFYWPGMLSDIESFIAGCSVCMKYSRANTQEPLINHTIPEIPFNKVGVDIAEKAGINYLVVFDYFSRWIEIVKLNGKTSFDIINKLKDIFSHNGIPATIIADNVPFNSYEFRNFAQEWNFKIVTSSPNYPKSHGLAEKGVHIAKVMLNKAQEERKDIQLFLLNYRNTPVAGLKMSPAQLLMSRNLRSKLPIQEKWLKPVLINEDVHKEMNNNQHKQKIYYDKRAKSTVHEYKEGEEVLVQNMFSHEWEKAVVEKKLDVPRSYLIRLNRNDRVLRRNTIHMKKIKNINQPRQMTRAEMPIEEKNQLRRSVRKTNVPKKLDL